MIRKTDITFTYLIGTNMINFYCKNIVFKTIVIDIYRDVVENMVLYKTFDLSCWHYTEADGHIIKYDLKGQYDI